MGIPNASCVLIPSPPNSCSDPDSFFCMTASTALAASSQQLAPFQNYAPAIHDADSLSLNFDLSSDPDGKIGSVAETFPLITIPILPIPMRLWLVHQAMGQFLLPLFTTSRL
ncbi:hypothetical protein P175DRAFT_0531913 [Aspergillus ochraceoroseus IBT 24754]|uniref:Uncharacterized protein n=1 Tax=Aspergillus ochraceoroseus IBT 24754 TaxID=1392256 RepID=A0A2T5LWE7_9EURO|nr:uncharacterized protein P175DRAFT_0531913 [Aspergillus ochraceoroseus IBT 24754]PTU20573.1 hypothetical protein P175DRAFT_0531913 [Aspergillus ochraceoroseus IBT 24754]